MVSESDWDWFDWKTEEEEKLEQLAYDEHIESVYDEIKENEEQIKNGEKNEI